VETNIVILDTGMRPAAEIAQAAAEQDVIISALGPRMLRVVTHLGVSPEQGAEAGAVVGDLLG
jgi:threonine aldolase